MTGILHPIGPARCGPVDASPAVQRARPAGLAQDPLNQIIAEKAAAVAASSRADEVARREAVLASVVDAVLPLHIARECKLPDADTIARHNLIMEEFGKWCWREKVGHLPAKPATLLAYLVARIARGLSTAEAREIVAGVQFAHDVSEQYLDCSFPRAALAFLAEIEAVEAAEAAAQIELKTNGHEH
jgi:hypothetical protein